MSDFKLGAVESRFADIIWAHEPLPSPELVKLAEGELQWKKSTTYTVLKRLCDRGLFQNRAGVVSARLTRQEFYARQSEQFVNDTFAGSLPAFCTAFTTRKKLTAQELDQLQAMIDQMKGET